MASRNIVFNILRCVSLAVVFDFSPFFIFQVWLIRSLLRSNVQSSRIFVHGFAVYLVYNSKQLSKGEKLRMYKRSIKLMFITQINDSGTVIWKIEQHICQSKNVTNFTPPLPPKYLMLKHFDVTQKLVPSKDHFNNKKHYKCKNAILKQKIHLF